MKKLIITYIISLFFVTCLSQESNSIKWWNPAKHEFPVVEGNGWSGETVSPYCRLPQQTKSYVSNETWHSSKHSAGLMLRFRTNASGIVIRYKAELSDLCKKHMVTTLEKGVDLYAINNDGKELWFPAIKSIADTIRYSYENLKPNEGYPHNKGREYRLYLPMESELKWLEIGVADTAYFCALPIRREKPIVIFGTSMVQGTSTSRPGLTWTNILGRRLDIPLVNLGFDNSLCLDSATVGLITELDAQMYILNFSWDIPSYNLEKSVDRNELKNKIIECVRYLKLRYPQMPILIVEHPCPTNNSKNEGGNCVSETANRLQQEAYSYILQNGFEKVYYLTCKGINLNEDSWVDDFRFSDIGMLSYARICEKKVRQILDLPIGEISTTRPVTQLRELNNYDWEARHNQILEMNKTNPPRIVFLANSIVHRWGGLPRDSIVCEEETWETILTPNGTRNLAYGWDRIENVLWRVYHGELDGYDADQIFMMIGINNLHNNDTDEEIIIGLENLTRIIKRKQPKAQITLLGILPRSIYEKRIAELNWHVARIAGEQDIKYADIGRVLLNENYKIDETLFSDGVHPNAVGYRKLRTALKPLILTK